MNLLIVEDDPLIVDVITTIFRIGCPNFNIKSVASGNRGIDLISTFEPNIVILDLGLPDINGFEVLKQIRAFSQVPVLIVSVRGEESDVVKALSLGANDYIIKPFRQMELLARVKRLLTNKQFYEEDLTISCGSLHFGDSLRQVWDNDKPIILTTSEGRIFYLLVKNANKVVSYEELSDILWGDYYAGARASLKTYILRLRKKIEESTPSKMILNSPGRGYILKIS